MCVELREILVHNTVEVAVPVVLCGGGAVETETETEAVLDVVRDDILGRLDIVDWIVAELFVTAV